MAARQRSCPRPARKVRHASSGSGQDADERPVVSVELISLFKGRYTLVLLHAVFRILVDICFTSYAFFSLFFCVHMFRFSSRTSSRLLIFQRLDISNVDLKRSLMNNLGLIRG